MFFKNSYFLLILIKLGKISYRSELWTVIVYNDSYTNKLMKAFWESTKINFRYSFIVRISDIDFQDYIFILKNSKFANWLLALFKTCKLSMINYMRTSDIVNSTIIIRKDLSIFPIKTGSIIITTALFTSMFFSILLEKKIVMLQWFVQLLILFISLGVIFCSSKWEEMKETSAVISYINIAKYKINWKIG